MAHWAARPSQRNLGKCLPTVRCWRTKDVDIPCKAMQYIEHGHLKKNVSNHWLRPLTCLCDGSDTIPSSINHYQSTILLYRLFHVIYFYDVFFFFFNTVHFLLQKFPCYKGDVLFRSKKPPDFFFQGSSAGRLAHGAGDWLGTMLGVFWYIAWEYLGRKNWTIPGFVERRFFNCHCIY